MVSESVLFISHGDKSLVD